MKEALLKLPSSAHPIMVMRPTVQVAKASRPCPAPYAVIQVGAMVRVAQASRVCVTHCRSGDQADDGRRSDIATGRDAARGVSLHCPRYLGRSGTRPWRWEFPVAGRDAPPGASLQGLLQPGLLRTKPRAAFSPD